MTLFGIIWLFLILYFVYFNKYRYFILLLLLSAVLQSTNVVTINGIGIGPQTVTSFIFIVYSFVRSIKDGKLRISKVLFVVRIVLYLILLYIIIFSFHFNTLLSNSYKILQLALYILSFAILCKDGRKLSNEFLDYSVKLISIFLLILGLIQVCTTTNIIPRLFILTKLFWNETGEASVVQYYMNNYFRFFSTFMEPSYYVTFANGALIYFIHTRSENNKNIFYILSLIASIILSFSSTGYGALAITIIIYLFFSNQSKKKIYIFVGAIIGYAVMYHFFRDVLNSVIFNKSEGGSATARYYWNLSALKTFKSSPLIGIGYKNCRASSIVYTILAESGIIGMSEYIILNISLILPIFKSKDNINKYQIGFIFSIISVVIAQVIAVPDFDLCTFWMWMNYLAIATSINRKIKYERSNTLVLK